MVAALARTRAVPNRGLDFQRVVRACCHRAARLRKNDTSHRAPKRACRRRHQPCCDRGRGAVVGTPIPVRRPGFPPSGRPPAGAENAGYGLILCGATVTSPAYMDGLLATLKADEEFVVRLEADPVVLRRRIVEREPPSWSGLPSLLAATAEISAHEPPAPGRGRSLFHHGRHAARNRGSGAEDASPHPRAAQFRQTLLGRRHAPPRSGVDARAPSRGREGGGDLLLRE